MLGLNVVNEKQLMSTLVIVPVAYFVSFLKRGRISCLKSSHKVFSPQKSQLGYVLAALLLNKHSKGEGEEESQSEGRTAALPEGWERNKFLWVLLCTQTYLLIRRMANMTLKSM